MEETDLFRNLVESHKLSQAEIPYNFDAYLTLSIVGRPVLRGWVQWAKKSPKTFYTFIYEGFEGGEARWDYVSEELYNSIMRWK